MEALLAKDPNNLAAYDNLAVAHEKLGNPDAAIRVILQKEKVKPGEYTTYANLGTFYLHKGDFENGIAYIRKALQTNPSAHFGREEYQLKLAEFLRDGRENPWLLREVNFLGIRDGKVLTPGELKVRSARAATQPAADALDDDTDTGWAYRGHPAALKDLGLKDNVFDGIVGMIRFGTGRSAELYLTLGDLLTLRGDKILAHRAYQRALDLNHPRKKYIESVMKVIAGTVTDEEALRPETIAAERAAADKWVKAYQDYEDNLLRTGKDVNDEASYAVFYKEHGQAREALGFAAQDLLPRDPTARAALVIMAVVVAAILFLALVLAKLRRRRRQRTGRFAANP
jgi:tetratricopeptide (TPR) repeat protein